MGTSAGGQRPKAIIGMDETTGGILFSKFIQLVEPFPFTFEVSLVLVLIGIVVGMIGSSKAVRKYLKI